MRRLLQIPPRLRGDQNGSVTIEFALLMVFLLMVAAAGVDLSNISGLTREIERSATQIATAIVSCPSGRNRCMSDFMEDYRTRKANVLIRFSSSELTIMQINKIAGGIRVCAGNGTYLDSDIMTNAKTVLGDSDVAIVVVISTTYLPFLPVFTKLFIGGASTTLTGHAIAVQVIDEEVC
jgi:Flp pilus assembly protein TadG